tara:strand:+ start:23848 stop:25506 length:1659 start_codon:yes stop_codon:yes gene_type:complete
LGYFKKERGEKMSESYVPKETVADVQQYKCLALPERGLTQADAEFYGIRSAVNQKDGKTVEATYFPYYNKAGELTGFKKRDWTVTKDHDFHFTTVGTVKVNAQMFGQMQTPKGGRKLIIVEGEEEVPATRRAILDSLKGTKYEGKIEPSVVSISMGTANAAECVAHNLDFVQSFNDIVLAFDSDQATAKELKKGILKGKEAKEEVAGLLLSDNIYTITHPHGMKDSRDCLLNGHSSELGKILAFGLEKYSPEKIICGDDVDLDSLLEPLREGHYIDRYPKLMEKLHGIRTGNELITYTAFSGVGKSTLNREIAWELVAAGYKVGFIFLEEPTKKTQQSLVALELGVRLPDFRKNPLAVATREQALEAKNKVISNGRTYFLDHFGSMKVDKLMQQIKYLHFICGCEHIFIDHISMVVAGLESNNERKDIDMLYEELAAFMTNNNVTVHAVCHLKRVEDNAPKVKEGEEPKAYWRQVKKEFLRGSSGIEQMSSCIIALENEVLPDETRGRVRTKVLKDREWGELGVCDTMLQLEDGRLHVVPEDDGWVYKPPFI